MVAAIDILNIHKTSWNESAMKLRFQEIRLFTTYKRIILAIMANTNSDVLGSFSFNKFFTKSFPLPFSSLDVPFNVPPPDGIVNLNVDLLIVLAY